MSEEDTFSKIGDAITDSNITKDRISATIKRKVKSKQKRKEKYYMESPGMLDSVLPDGDEKSIKRTIGAGVAIITLIGVFSICAAGFLAFMSEIVAEIGFFFALLLFMICAGIIIGLVGFLFVTRSRHEKDEEEIRRRLE
jgi:uncharacterized membrane protein